MVMGMSDFNDRDWFGAYWRLSDWFGVPYYPSYSVDDLRAANERADIAESKVAELEAGREEDKERIRILEASAEKDKHLRRNEAVAKKQAEARRRNERMYRDDNVSLKREKEKMLKVMEREGIIWDADHD